MRDFKVDRFSLFVLLTFGVFAVLPTTQSLGQDANLPYAALSLALTVAAIVILRSRGIREHSAPLPWRWIGIGVAASLAIRVSISLIDSYLTGRPALLVQHSLTAGTVAFAILTYLGLAVLEEPAFRGFLWGYLENRNWKVFWIWIFQAVVFWLAHMWQIQEPLQFWLGLPVGGLMFGWLVIESNSIAPSLVAHAIYNALSFFL